MSQKKKKTKKHAGRYVCLHGSVKSLFSSFLSFSRHELIKTVKELLSDIKTDDSLQAITRRQNQWTMGKSRACLGVCHQAIFQRKAIECNPHSLKKNKTIYRGDYICIEIYLTNYFESWVKTLNML